MGNIGTYSNDVVNDEHVDKLFVDVYNGHVFRVVGVDEESNHYHVRREVKLDGKLVKKGNILRWSAWYFRIYAKEFKQSYVDEVIKELQEKIDRWHTAAQIKLG